MLRVRPAWDGYWVLAAWSVGLTGLLAAGWAHAGLLHLAGVSWLRNIVAYAHISLAYTYALPALRRQTVATGAFGPYLLLFAAAVAGYAALQRWWLPMSLDYLFVVLLFMAHHGANDLAFRLDARDAAARWTWTPRRRAWLALVIGVLLVDRTGAPVHPWFAAHGPLAAAWLAGWLWYGWRYVRRDATAWPLAGWVVAGWVGWLCARQPGGELILSSRERFAWIVIYHCIAWYVFYARRLAARHGGWRRRPAGAGWAGWRKSAAGFIAYACLWNAAVAGLALAAHPLAAQVTALTRLNWFELHTVAHILFGVGAVHLATWLSARRTASGTAAPQPA